MRELNYESVFKLRHGIFVAFHFRLPPNPMPFRLDVTVALLGIFNLGNRGKNFLVVIRRRVFCR